jgi:hypothetical protein
MDLIEGFMQLACVINKNCVISSSFRVSFCVVKYTFSRLRFTILSALYIQNDQQQND